MLRCQALGVPKLSPLLQAFITTETGEQIAVSLDECTAPADDSDGGELEEEKFGVATGDAGSDDFYEVPYKEIFIVSPVVAVQPSAATEEAAGKVISAH